MLAVLAMAAAASSVTAATPSGRCDYTAGAPTVQVDGSPFAVEPTKDGCWLFVSMVSERGGRAGIAVLHNDSGRFEVARTIDVPGGVKGLMLSHDGTLLLAASGDSVRVFDASKLQAGAPAEVGRILEGAGSNTTDLALSADDRLLFASDEGAARITVSDLERGRREGFGPKAVIGRIPQGAFPVGLALSPDGTRLFATSERAAASRTFPPRCHPEQREGGADHPEGALSVIDVAKAATDPAHAVLAVLPAGCNPVRVALTDNGAKAWVTARGDNAVYSIAVESIGESAKISRTRYGVGSAPVALVTQPGSHLIWISNSNRFSSGNGDVQSLSVTDGSVTAIKSGRFPRDLRFLPNGHTLIVAMFGSHAVQFIPTTGITTSP